MTQTSPPPEKHHRIAIRRPVTMAMLFLTLVVFGWKSYQGLPVNLMPDISYPTLTVRTEFEGAAPEDVEKLLTRPLEETLSIVGGMVEISSTSRPGLSEVVLEFNWGTDMNVAQQDVRDRLDLFQAPREVTEKPVILRYDPTLDPVLRVAITGRDYPDVADPVERLRRSREDLTVIREAAERHMKSDLEAEVGIAQVGVKGGREEEIQVLVDAERLKNLGLSLTNIVNGLAQQNINLSGGRLKEGKTEYLVRTLNEFTDVRAIGRSIIGATDGTPIKLSDVAQVFLGEKDADTVVRINGQEAVELDIFKEGDANTVQVCNKLKDLLGYERKTTAFERAASWLRKTARSMGYLGGQDDKKDEDARKAELAKTLRSRLPEYAKVSLVSDQSRFITAAIDEVKSTAVVGGVLALIVLYCFLREMRSTLLIGVSIPVSVISTFIPMFMQGITLNIMSLGGLALGIGMLVDNSIVVLESIFRCREEGDEHVDAVDRGTGEVGGAVTSSTLTTIAVFFPIAFVEGVAGQLFRDQALTVTYSLLASLLVAMYLVPMVASRKAVSLHAGEEVIWLLRAYRQSRRVEGVTRTAAVLGIVPTSLGYARGSVVETWTGNLGPVLSAFRRREGAGPDGMGAAAMYIRRAAALVSAPLYVVLFTLQVALRLLALCLVTLAFLVGGLFFLAFSLVARALRLVLWVPLTLFDLGFRTTRWLYEAGLRRGLQWGPILVVAVLALAVHAGFTARKLGSELIPPMKQGEFGIRVEAPPGTRLEETERRSRELEALILQVPEVETCTTQIGVSESGSTGVRAENIAQFTVKLRDPEQTVPRQDAIIEQLRARLDAATPDEVTFTLPSLFSFKTAVELQIRGDDLRELRAVGERMLVAVRDVPGVKDAELSMKTGYPEVIIELDRDLLASKGISPEQVAQRLRTEVQGDIATRFNQGGYKIDLRVRSDRDRMKSVQDLRAMSVVDGHPPIPLASVARISVEEGPSEIRRIDQRQVAVITANIEGRDLGAVSKDLESRAQAVGKPADYFVVLGGQNRELEVSYSSLRFALLLAMFLVYVVMACQFESIIHPGLIMFSMPLAFIGVIYALYLLHIDLSIMVYIGGIVLAGIVVNNAIVLVDYVNQLRARGLPKREALVEAGKVRLRPILMTTLTTVLGLIPMANTVGEGAEVRSPLAITLIAGLSTSTLLTLVFIPIIYDLFGGRDKA